MAGEEPYASWVFSEGSELARLMQEDKDLGQYETAQQEAATGSDDHVRLAATPIIDTPPRHCKVFPGSISQRWRD